MQGPARVFVREPDAVAAVKGQGDRPIRPGDVLVLMGRGPLGSGMEEIYQITSALRYLSWGHEVAVVTDCAFLRREHGGLHRPGCARGLGRRAAGQAPRR